MPGDEIPENIHNFFDQDKNSQDRQSQVGGGGWPILNNNTWVGIQRQNGGPLTFNSRNHTSQSSDSEHGNGLQPIQRPSGSNLSQKAELVRSQPRNQQLNLNGYMHGSQALQARPIQAEFQGYGGVSDGHNLMQRGFSSFQSPQNSSHGYNSALTRSSERPEATEAPVNFDFLGDQQLMRSQHPGISQACPIQPQRISDMQLWQQHLLYKHLKEMQRQQQLMQLQQGVTQQNSLSQLSDVGRQASSNESLAVLSGMPITNASNNMWSNELAGGDLRLPSSSPMFLSGNMNWGQRSSVQGTPIGLMISPNQGQAVRTMGPPPQQPDESLYGIPVARTRGTLNHQSQFQGTHGTTHDISSMQVNIRAGVNQTEEPSMQLSVFNCFQSDQSAVPGQGYLQDGVSLAKQGFKEKSLLQNATIQGASSGATSENFQHVNHISPTVKVQEMSGLLCEKAGEQVTPSHVIASLDPTEVKLLFNTDDGNQDPSFGVSSDRSTGGYLHGNLTQSDNYFSSFPTINSGSWSALMQEAVEASSSDTGLNEEWSGLNFQKTELSSGNHSAMLQDDNRKQQAWHGQNFQNTSSITSRPLPLFNDANASSNCHATPNFQQPMNFSLQQNERVSADAFQESFQQSSEEAVSKPFDDIHHQTKQLDGGSIQTQTQFNNFSNGVWAGQTPKEPANSTHSSEAEFNPHNMQHSWVHHPKVSLQNLSERKLDGWNAQSLAHMGGNASNFYNNNDKRQDVEESDTERTINMETDHDGSMWKVAGTGAATTFPSSAGRIETVGSETGSPMNRNKDSCTVNVSAIMNSNSLNMNQEINQQVLSRHHVDYGKHVAVDALFQNKKEEVTAKYQNQLTGGLQTWDSSMYNTDRKSGESCVHKQENNLPEDGTSDRFLSTNSQPWQNTEDGGSGKENSLLARNESQSLANSSLKSSAQSGQRNMGPRRFQFHPMGNLEMSRESIDPQRHNLYSQGLSQSAAQGLRNQERGYIGHSQFAGHALNNALDAGKGHLIDLQRNVKAAEEIQYRGAISSDSPTPPFNGSTSQFPENKRAGLSSQNMLELLHKVDQSREGKTVERLSFSEQNTTSGRHEADTSDGSSSHLQLSQSSSFQGFGLKLAPPSQRQSITDHDLPPQASLQVANDFNQRNLDSGTRGEDQSRPPSSSSVQSAPSDDDTAQKEKQGDKSFPSGRTNNVMYSNFQGNPMASAAYSLRMNQYLLQQGKQQQQLQWKQLQEQRQRFTSASVSRPSDQSQHIHQVGIDGKQFSHPGRRQKSHNGATLNQSSEESMPSRAGWLPASGLPSSMDTCSSAASQFYPANTGHSQPRNAGSDARSSGQQIPAVERSVAHPSATPAVSQQGGFSTMLHNVWTSVSSQQRLSGLQPQKIISNVLQSRSPLPGGRESLHAPQKLDNHNMRKGESAPSEFGACSTNSQQSTYSEDRSLKENASQQMPPPDRVDADPKTGSVPRGPVMEPEAKDHSDGNPAFSISPSVCSHQQDLSKGKCVQDSVIDGHKGQVSLSSIASSGAYVHSLESSDVQKRNNYSLLQQMQAMKGTDSDPAGRAAKRLKEADFGMDNSQMDWAPHQRYICGQNQVFREKDATSQNVSFPTDNRMLSFSARDNKETSASMPMHNIGREVPSQDQLAYKQHDLQNHSHPLGKTPTTPFAGGSERQKISPQMAPSWFEKYGNYKNGQTLTTYDGLDSFQRNANASGQNYVLSNVSEGMVQHNVPEQKDDASPVGSLQQSMSPATIESNHAIPPGHLPLEVIDNNIILVPKKRKSATSDFLPWHKEVTQGSGMLKSISTMEQDWARASNRLIEKLEEEFEMIEDGMVRSRRRLIFTAQLMQQILSTVPATYLRADAAASYESVIYLMAKLILGDACSLRSCSGSRADLDGGNMISGKLNIYEKEGHNHFSRFMEDFVVRSKRLENEFLRLDRRASILDIRVECQDLERNSIVNRFAKFHGRFQSEGVEGSTSEAAPRRSFPQRHVTAHALPRNLPEGVICLSL